MSWFLIRKKICAGATLFALLIQLVAYFGHIHLGHIGGHSSLPQSIGASGHTPFDGSSDEQAGYVCDICTTLNLTASGQIGIAPALPTRFASHVITATIPAETVRTLSPRVDFRSRAPPIA